MLGEEEWCMKYNAREVDRLRKAGYKLEWSDRGYQVRHKDAWVAGAASDISYYKNKRRHWRHRRKDTMMFMYHAILAACAHEKRSCSAVG